MSDIAGELARVKGAFAQPTLTLLHQRQAPVVITIFRAAFGRNNKPIPTARLHSQVEEHLAAIRAAGESDVPAGSGRDICQRWMRGQWLVRSLDELGNEVYTLTSHAQQALELVKSMTRDRATLSEHRIATILGTVRRFNSEANPDRGARVTLLNEEMARLKAERDRLVDGAEMVSATEEYMLEGYTELLSLISALPSDFARVEERFATIRGEILAAFRAEDRPAGEVIDDYLARADALMTATHEGRAFEGAFALLRDDALVTQLREDLTALLDHPLSDGILGDADRAELRGTVRLVRDGLDRVLAQRSRVTATLREYIVSHDAARDRELEQTLRQVESELMGWMATTGPRATHDVSLLPLRTNLDHLRERFYDPADDVLPDRISAGDPDDAPSLSLSDLMAQGGPQLSSLRQRLEDALTALLPAGSLGELFEGLEPSLRRPVEIFGLLHLAADREWEPEDVAEEFAAVRPDGSLRTFSVPRMPLPDPDLTESESRA
ncbi:MULTISPECIES: DUF3375 domain-containing protein [unclassified Nocardioides]|uniref:DUF3375 domain-containing protein n=1 Tax=unclassified Nocardioides TaxID=2615069 RepID=UPI0006F65292|nr:MULTISPECIES: DUF3375 domain-containing protein [unclassified Nocardioides]KRA32522.1 hypothetical protein ASD81_13275 [Nocardioides sp. Root614]KRA89176.1 hypothetical protein ASD84_13540 [Nocardioides sp. Root682]